MNKVYVVTSGIYSDYHICAIFSTREKAEEWASVFLTDKYDEPEIQEWVVDDGTEVMNLQRQGWSSYDVLIGEGGRVYGIQKTTDGTRSDYSYVYEALKGIRNESFSTTVFARDEKHAVKIANERYAAEKMKRDLQKE